MDERRKVSSKLLFLSPLCMLYTVGEKFLMELGLPMTAWYISPGCLRIRACMKASCSPHPSPHPPVSGDPRTVRRTKAPSVLLLLPREQHAGPLPILITRIYLSLEFRTPSVRKDTDTGCGRVTAQVGGEMKCLEIILVT